MGQLHSGQGRTCSDEECGGKAFSDDDLVNREGTWRARGRLRFLALTRSIKAPSATPGGRDRTPRPLKTSRTTGDIAGPLGCTFVQNLTPKVSSNGVVRTGQCDGVKGKLLLSHSHTTGDCRAESVVQLGCGNQVGIIGNQGGISGSQGRFGKTQCEISENRSGMSEIQERMSWNQIRMSGNQSGMSGNSTPMSSQSPSLRGKNGCLPSITKTRSVEKCGSLGLVNGSARSPSNDSRIKTILHAAEPPQIRTTFDARMQTILDQTAMFLAHEIEPSTMSEYLQRRAKRCKKKNISIRQAAVATCHEDVQRVLSDVIRDPDSDDFRLLCPTLRRLDENSYVAEFLETLAVMLKLASSTDEEVFEDRKTLSERLIYARCVPDVICTCGCYSNYVNQEINCAYLRNKPYGKYLRNTDDLKLTEGKANGIRVDVDIQYVDRETRIAKPFSDVATMKRFKWRKSQLLLSDKIAEYKPALPLIDLSDRFVPVMSVTLYDQCLCDLRMRRLARALLASSCTRVLRLLRARFDVPGMVRLAHTLEGIKGLHELDVTSCSLGHDGAMYLAAALRSNATLRVLNLSRNNIGARGAANIARGLQRNRTLAELDIGLNRVGDKGAMSLAVVVSSAGCSLRKLRLYSNDILDDGFVVLFEALRHNFKLSHLDVSGNFIGDTSLRILADVLVVNRSLREIVANGCGVTAGACGALARPLRANNVLRRLALSDNPELGDVGLALLAEGLVYNRGVEEIACNACNIGNRGLLRLLDVVRYNGVLKTIHLCDNNICCCRPCYRLSPRLTAIKGCKSDVVNTEFRFADVTTNDCSNGDIIITDHSDVRFDRHSNFEAKIHEDRSGLAKLTMAHNSITMADCHNRDVTAFGHRRSESVSPCKRSRRDVIVNGYHSFDRTFLRHVSHPRAGVSYIVSDVSVEGGIDDVMYDRLVEAAQSNPLLRIFLSGNRFDEPSRLVLSAFYCNG